VGEGWRREEVGVASLLALIVDGGGGRREVVWVVVGRCWVWNFIHLGRYNDENMEIEAPIAEGFSAYFIPVSTV